MTLKLAADLSLPLDAVTQTFLIVGKRGSGKSNTAARLVEQFHRAKLPTVVLDPTDTWWGLKAGRDGGRGLDVYVFGGRKADLPLEAGGGALIAEVLCEHRLSMVLSVKHLSGRERSGFMVAFAQTLFQKWAGGPLHVVLEEAHELAPQMSGGRGAGNQDNEAAMLGAFKKLWKLGRASGIGGTAVTQRPASLSKDITTQAEILIAHRTIGPQDVKAVGEWVKYHGEQLGILAELPSLPTGEAFVWAPEFPEGAPLGLRRTTVLLRDTYDSASTPKVGEHRVEPKELAAVDLERLRTKMAATIEKAKAEDPRELRRQIVELKAQLSKAQRVEPSSPAKETRVEVLTDADRDLLKAWADRFGDFMADAKEREVSILMRVHELIEKITREHEAFQAHNLQRASKLIEQKGFQKILDKLAAVTPHPHTHATTQRGVAGDGRPTPLRAERERLPHDPDRGVRPSARTARPAAGIPSSGPLPPGELATLTAALQYPGLDRKRLGVLTGYKRSSRDAYVARLGTKGLVEVQGASLFPTDDGRAALNAFKPLPTGAALIDYWRDRLPDGERRSLDVLISAGQGQDVEREAINEATGYKRSSRDAYLTRLRARGLVEFVGRGLVKASDELFDE